MSAVRKINSVIMKKAGLKKVGFLRLSHIYDCLSYISVNNTVDKFGDDFDANLLTWKEVMSISTGSGFVFCIR